jgi:ribokinase
MVLLNAAPAQRLKPEVFAQLDALVVNEREATALGDLEDPSAAAAALRAMGAKIVIVTLGPAGSLFCDDAGVHRVEPFAVNSVDSTGAGDAFVGALAVGLAAKLPGEAAIRFANAAGAAATCSLGAQAALPRLDDLRRLFGLHVPSLEA